MPDICLPCLLLQKSIAKTKHLGAHGDRARPRRERTYVSIIPYLVILSREKSIYCVFEHFLQYEHLLDFRTKIVLFYPFLHLVRARSRINQGRFPLAFVNFYKKRQFFSTNLKSKAPRLQAKILHKGQITPYALPKSARSGSHPAQKRLGYTIPSLKYMI